LINKKKGWVFQAQYDDMLDCFASGIEHVSWLRLGADPDVWTDQPFVNKVFDVGFVGNVWDSARQTSLDMIRGAGMSLCFPGHGGAKMEAGAELLRKSKVGFNISSFFGQPEAFDVNMRVFEELSCGLPIVTNNVSSLTKIFGDPLPKWIWTYDSLDQIVPRLRHATNSEEFQSYGKDARQWILNYGTYTLQMQSALETLRSQKMIA
jgi:hypothetical protein